MSCATKSFIDKMQEFGDTDRVGVLKVRVWLTTATVLVCLVAGVLSDWVRVLHLLFLPT